MKEPIQIIANTHAVINDGALTPHVEIGIILSEPGYAIVESQVVRNRTLETVRFSASPEVIRKLAEQMVKMAEAAESDVAEARANDLAAKPGELPPASLLSQAVLHVSALRRIESMDTSQTASPDQCAAVAYAMDHLRSGDQSPHPDTDRLDWLLAMLLRGTAYLRMSLISSGHINGDKNEDPVLDRAAIDAAREGGAK